MSLETPQLPSVSATETVKFTLSAYPQVTSIHMTPDHYGVPGRLNWQKVVNLKLTPTINNQVLVLEGRSLRFTDSVYVSAQMPSDSFDPITYGSSFSANEDGWVGVYGNLSRTDNYAGEAHVLKFEPTNMNVGHYINKDLDISSGDRYQISGKYYIANPADNATDGIAIYNDTTAGPIYRCDDCMESWNDFSIEFTGTAVPYIYFYGMKNNTTTYNPGPDDTFGVKDVVLKKLSHPFITSFSALSADTTVSRFLTASTLSSLFPTFSGISVNNLSGSGFQILSDNVLEVTLPTLEKAGKLDIIIVNGAGWNSLQKSLQTIINIYG